jgi:hypothetical protein
VLFQTRRVAASGAKHCEERERESRWAFACGGSNREDFPPE